MTGAPLPPPPSRPATDLSRLRIDRDAPPAAGRRRRGPWPLVAAAAVVVAAVLWLRSGAGPLGRPAVDVALVRATESAAAAAGTPVLSASGFVVARIRAAVAPEMTGRLVELRVDEGDRVAKGDLIARLADADLIAAEAEARAAVASAEAGLREAQATRADLRREANRQVDLEGQGLTSGAARDAAVTAADAADARVATAEARVETARAALGVARAQLAKARIFAPFDGTVLEKNAELGEIVGPSFGGTSAGGGVPVVTLADLGSVEVEVDVNEAYIERVLPGMPAEIVLDAYADRPYAGAVRQIVPTADRQKATVRVKVRFEAADERVLPEMGVRVSFLAAAPEGAGGDAGAQVWIPKEAVRRIGGGTAVFVLRGDRVKLQPVTVGPPAGADVQVLGGLGPGERVVTGDVPLADGDRVKVREAPGS